MDARTEHREYNYCLDFLKGIACIFVVLMHCEFPGKLGVVVQTISRFCVPLFFMVSGYFCFNDNMNKIDIKSKILHILKITVVATAFYSLVVLFDRFVFGKPIYISVRGMFNWAVFNVPMAVVGQLWFLYALIYVYILFAIVKKYNLYKIAFYSIPLLLLLYVILAQISYLLNIPVQNMYYRNFLIEGFPLFMLGMFLHKYKERIVIKNNVLIAIVIISTILCVVERKLLGRDFGVNISTFPQVTAMFLYAVSNPEKHAGFIQRLGKNISMLIYVIHPFVWHSLEKTYVAFGIQNNIIALYIMPIIVVVLSALISLLVLEIMKKTRRKQHA